MTQAEEINRDRAELGEEATLKLLTKCQANVRALCMVEAQQQAHRGSLATLPPSPSLPPLPPHNPRHPRHPHHRHPPCTRQAHAMHTPCTRQAHKSSLAGLRTELPEEVVPAELQRVFAESLKKHTEAHASKADVDQRREMRRLRALMTGEAAEEGMDEGGDEG